jgi:hypothetical protein
MDGSRRNISREDVVSFSARHEIPTRIAKAILRIHGPSAAQCDAAAIAYRKRVEGQVAGPLKPAPENERQSFHHGPLRPNL